MLNSFQSNQVGLDAKHSDESISRILSGHCQPSIRRVLFPNTVCKSKEVTGSSYIPDMPMAQNHVPPQKTDTLCWQYWCLSYHFPPSNWSLLCTLSTPTQNSQAICGSTQLPHSQPILWPGGLSAVVEMRGNNFSLGQRQLCFSSRAGVTKWSTTLVNFWILPWDFTWFFGQFSPVSKHQTFMG